jgi:hypothetical protein
MAGYTRQSIADIINGADITAPPLNAEFDQLASAFDSATGHSHDGSSGNSPKIDLTTSVTGYLPAIHGGIGGKNNFATATNPTVTDDSVAGYAPGSMWENTSTGRIFICVGNTSGSAVWRELVQVETSNKIEPIAHDSIDLGTPTVRFQDIYLSGSVSAATNISAGGTLNVTGLSTLASLNVTGATTLDGNITLGNTTLDNITFTGRVASDVVPNGDYDLGSPTQEWNDLFIDGIAHVDTLDVDENAGIDGNLSVTGNTTLTGTLGVTGDVTVANLTATGTSAITSIDVASGAIDSTTIGNSIAADGTFVNLTASTSLTAATADINGGTLDGVTIGGTSSAPATVTNLTATGTSTLSTVDINAGAIDGTTIGATSHTTGKFTTLQSTGLATLNSVNIDGGNIDGTAIGSTTTSSGAFTTLSASGGITGDLTGNVTGDLQGNVTGNVQGDLTGNVTAATGSSTFNNVTINGTLNMDANTTATITNLTDPTNAQDAATRNYVDTSIANLVDSAPGTLDTLNELAAALGDDPNFSTTITNSIATKLPLAGGTMTGAIAMGTNKITGLGDPTAAQDAATQNYVTNNFLDLTGGTMTGAIDMGSNKVTSSATPSTGNDLTNKTYVDGVLGSATAASASAAAAATSETNAATSETNAANSATAAASSATSAANSYDDFDDRYLGAKATAPTVDNDGDALITGALYFDTTTNTMKVYGTSGWTAAGSSVNGTSDRQTYTATAGQTVFAATYDAGYVDVYLNGVKLLAGTDFTATNGTSITLASGAAVNDIVDIVAYGTFVLADHYTKTQADARYVEVAGDTMTGGLTIQPASVGSFTANAAADDLVVENNGNAGITIVSPDANYSGLIFASVTDPTGSIIEFNYNNATLDLGTATSGGVLRLRSGNYTEAAQFDASGNFLVGTTDPLPVANNDASGIALRADGNAQFSRSGAATARFNRGTSNGEIVSFSYNGTTVGGIQSRADVVANLILDPRGSFEGVGLTAGSYDSTTSLLIPSDGQGVTSDGAMDLGGTSNRFRNLNLSGTAYASALQVSNATDAQLILDDTGGTAGGNMNTEVVFNAGGVFGGSVGYGTGGGYMAVNNNRGPLVINSNNSSGTASRVNAIFYNTSNVFNENAADLDFRVESDTNANLFFVDAGNGALAFGNSANTGQYNGTGNNGMGVNLVGQAGQYVTIQNQSDANIYLTKKSGYTDGRFIQFNQNNTIVGKIGVSTSISGKLYLAGDSGVQFRSDDILPTNSSGTYTDGALDIGDAGAKFRHGYFSGDLHAGGGVYIGNSTAANHLDDYEEGSFSPMTTTLAQVYHARYTKIGNLVTINCSFQMLSGQSRNFISLPFTPAADGVGKNVATNTSTNNRYAGTVSYFTPASGSTPVNLMLFHQGNQGAAAYFLSKDSTTQQSWPEAVDSTYGNIAVSFTYQTNS